MAPSPINSEVARGDGEGRVKPVILSIAAAGQAGARNPAHSAQLPGAEPISSSAAALVEASIFTVTLVAAATVR